MNSEQSEETCRYMDTRSGKYQSRIHRIKDPAITKSLNVEQMMKYYKRKNAKTAREREAEQIYSEQRRNEWADQKFKLDKDEEKHFERIEGRKKKEQDKKLRRKANAELAKQEESLLTQAV